ncbi:unnamed protein product, partial [Ectocarpus sp. 12 AP-2014]
LFPSRQRSPSPFPEGGSALADCGDTGGIRGWGRRADDAAAFGFLAPCTLFLPWLLCSALGLAVGGADATVVVIVVAVAVAVAASTAAAAGAAGCRDRTSRRKSCLAFGSTDSGGGARGVARRFLP